MFLATAGTAGQFASVPAQLARYMVYVGAFLYHVVAGYLFNTVLCPMSPRSATSSHHYHDDDKVLTLPSHLSNMTFCMLAHDRCTDLTATYRLPPSPSLLHH